MSPINVANLYSPATTIPAVPNINSYSTSMITNLTETSSIIPIATSSATSSITPIATSSTSSSTPASSSTIRSNQSLTENIFTESPLSTFYGNIDEFIQDITTQLQLEHKVSGIEVITINNTINVVKELWDWIKNTDNINLLKKPAISVITER